MEDHIIQIILLSVSFEPVIDEEPNGEIGDAVEIKARREISSIYLPGPGW